MPSPKLHTPNQLPTQLPGSAKITNLKSGNFAMVTRPLPACLSPPKERRDQLITAVSSSSSDYIPPSLSVGGSGPPHPLTISHPVPMPPSHLPAGWQDGWLDHQSPGLPIYSVQQPEREQTICRPDPRPAPPACGRRVQPPNTASCTTLFSTLADRCHPAGLPVLACPPHWTFLLCEDCLTFPCGPRTCTATTLGLAGQTLSSSTLSPAWGSDPCQDLCILPFLVSPAKEDSVHSSVKR